jgi:hypothetical protein
MRSRKYHPPHFTPRELRLYFLISGPPMFLAWMLTNWFDWNIWIFPAVAIVVRVQWRARMQRISLFGDKLKAEAAEKRASETHA